MLRIQLKPILLLAQELELDLQQDLKPRPQPKLATLETIVFARLGYAQSGNEGEGGGAWESGIMQACECGRMCESVPECARVGEWERVLFREWENGNVGQCESGRMRECDSGGTEDWETARVDEFQSGAV